MLHKRAFTRLLLPLLVLFGVGACEAEPLGAASEQQAAVIRDNALSPGGGWGCERFKFGDDVWIRTYYGGVGQFDMRLGAGGAISELRDAADGYRSLLSPGFVDTQNDTDRVIQLVTWDFDITHPGLPGAEDARLNFNQAGDLTNLFAPTFSVSSPDTRGCATDIRSGLIDSWNPRLSPYMREYSTLYTHYEIVAAGSILVRKVLYLGALYAGGAGTTGIVAPGNQPAYPALYLENWTPFNFPVFNAMALSVDGSGQPNWWYNRNNFPAYPNLETTSTYGYSILFDESRPAASDMVGLAFGSKPAECVGGPCSIQAVFNSMAWDDGMGLLPAVNLRNVPVGSLVDQSFYIVPYRGLTADSARYTAALAGAVPSVKLYLPGASLPPDVARIREGLVNDFDVLVSGGGYRTQHLAPLLRE